MEVIVENESRNELCFISKEDITAKNSHYFDSYSVVLVGTVPH